MKSLKSMWMIWCYLLKFSFTSMIKCVVFSLIVFVTLKWDCDIKTSEILSFLPLKNNSVTTGHNFLLDSISAIVSRNILTLSFLCWIVVFQIFINTINCSWIINKCIWTFQYFISYFFSSINKQLMLWLKWIFDA